MSNTPDAGFALIEAGQASSEVTFSETIIRLQARLSGAISQTNTPPGSPTVGDVYVCGTAPTGLWDGQANKITIWYGGSWRFVPDVTSDGSDIPMGARQEGWLMYFQSTNALMVFNGTAWAAV